MFKLRTFSFVLYKYHVPGIEGTSRLVRLTRVGAEGIPGARGEELTPDVLYENREVRIRRVVGKNLHNGQGYRTLSEWCI